VRLSFVFTGFSAGAGFFAADDGDALSADCRALAFADAADDAAVPVVAIGALFFVLSVPCEGLTLNMPC
jgi:hypothetical protein